MGDPDVGELPGPREPVRFPRLEFKTCPECIGAGRMRTDGVWITCGYCWGAMEVEVQRGARTHP